jgi:hypothetical protein
VNGPPRPPLGVAAPAAAAPVRRVVLPLRWLVSWLVGAVLTVAGTFLPWLYSGSVGKNSYELVGVGQRRLELPGWADALLVGWPFLGPALAVLAALLALRLRRTVGWLSLPIALVAGVLAVLVLIAAIGMDRALLSPAYAGPLLTAVGAATVAVAAVGFLRVRPGPPGDGGSAPAWP